MAATEQQVKVGDTVYVTKWLFTKGIVKATCARLGDKCWITISFSERFFNVPVAAWFYTFAQAKRRARFLIRCKRQSIEKQLAKLSELEQSLDGTTKTVVFKTKFAGKNKPLPYSLDD